MKGLFVLGGVIDSDYTGEIRCIVYNSSNQEYNYLAGSSICQIIPVEYYCSPVRAILQERGNNNFGSSGNIL